jgi:hypothetical protein
MPRIAGQVVILTVSDGGQSATWCHDLLGWTKPAATPGQDGHVALDHLVDRISGVELCLVDHRSGQAAFDEFRIGLDHLAFLVAHRDDLDTWVTRSPSDGNRRPALRIPSARRGLICCLNHGGIWHARKHNGNPHCPASTGGADVPDRIH